MRLKCRCRLSIKTLFSAAGASGLANAATEERDRDRVGAFVAERGRVAEEAVLVDRPVEGPLWILHVAQIGVQGLVLVGLERRKIWDMIGLDCPRDRSLFNRQRRGASREHGGANERQDTAQHKKAYPHLFLPYPFPVAQRRKRVARRVGAQKNP